MEAIHDPMAPTPSTSETEGVGVMLRERRIALGLSQSDVANVVKLPARRIEAMEKERWDELPDGPYLRGFLKNIARALHLDAASLIDRVDESLMRARNPDSILVTPGSTHATLPRRSGPAEGRYSGRLLMAGALVFALIAALIAWSGTDSFDRAMAAGRGWLDAWRTPAAATTPAATNAGANAGTNAGTNAPPSKTPAPPTSSDAVPLPPTGTNPLRGSAIPGDASSPVAASSGASDRAPTAAEGRIAMQFHFRGDSWVEVRSGDGTVLLSRLNAAGSHRSIDGEAPFSVVVGNARAVSLDYRGQPVDLAPFTRYEVARFTLS